MIIKAEKCKDCWYVKIIKTYCISTINGVFVIARNNGAKKKFQNKNDKGEVISIIFENNTNLKTERI